MGKIASFSSEIKVAVRSESGDYFQGFTETGSLNRETDVTDFKKLT
jgi:hypothetical protein